MNARRRRSKRKKKKKTNEEEEQKITGRTNQEELVEQEGQWLTLHKTEIATKRRCQCRLNSN